MRTQWVIRNTAGRLAAPSCAAVALTLLAAGPAHAEIYYGVGLGIGQSDNITRVDANETDEVIGTVGLDLTWRERTRRLNADASVDVSYFDYRDKTYDSEVVGTADGSLVVGIAPQRFSWAFQDSFGQAQSDPFAPLTPENRENINYFTTGPDLIVRFGEAMSARFLGRYSLTQYENNPFDSTRASGGVSLVRQPSQGTQLAFSLLTERIRFDQPVTSDFDQHSAFFSYSLITGRTELSTQLGYNWLEREAETEGGALATVSLTRELSPASTLRASLGTRFNDAGGALRDALQEQTVGGPDITATPDPFENRWASAEWLFARNRTRFSLGASWNEHRYEQSVILDGVRMSYLATLGRRIRPTLDVELHAQFDDEQFDNVDFNADELTVGAALTWRPGRIIECTLTVDRYDRNTSDGSAEYVENRAFFTITFRPRGQAPALEVGTL